MGFGQAKHGPDRVHVTPGPLSVEGLLAALEDEGYCELRNGRVYENRYVVVIEAHEDGTHQVR